MFPASPDVRGWYEEQRRNSPKTEGLFQVPNINSPLWGDAAGAFRLSRILTSAGVDHNLLAERLVSLPALRGENIVFFGSPEYSPAVARIMEKLPLQNEYAEKYGEHVIWDRGATNAAYVPGRASGGDYSEVYGLITIVPSDGDSSGGKRFVVISGISSAGTEAASEFFASSKLLSMLEEKLGRRWPKAMQIVVKATSSKVIALSCEYAGHRVLAW